MKGDLHSVVTFAFRHSRRTSTEFLTKSYRSVAGEVEEVDFTRRVGHVSTVVEAGDADVVRHSDEQVLF